MSDLLEYSGANEPSDTWGTLKEFEYTSDIPQTNLVWWWSADLITNASDGDAIQTLTDRTGNDSPTQGTLANRALYRTNAIAGMPALEFDGTNDAYVGTGLDNFFTGTDKPFTAFAVVRRDKATTSYYASFGRTTNAATIRWGYYSINGGHLAYLVDDVGGNDIIAAAGTFSSSPVIAVHLCPGTTVSSWQNETNLQSAVNFNLGAKTVDRFIIGARMNTGGLDFYWQGLIAEIIIYDNDLSTADRLMVTRYLRNKYKLYLD